MPAQDCNERQHGVQTIARSDKTLKRINFEQANVKREKETVPKWQLFLRRER
jgi:hypothetical protein